MNIQIAIVDDDARVRSQVASILRRSEGMTLSLECSSGEDAIKKIPKLQIDVVLMDIHLPGMSGIECVKRLCTQIKDPQVIMLTSYHDTEAVFASLKAGASGYLLKPVSTNQLLSGIRDVNLGGAPMSHQIARKVVQAFRKPPHEVILQDAMNQLTSREQEILLHLARGLLYKEISEKLQISYATVRTYIERIYQKLHVKSRAQAMAKMRGTFLSWEEVNH